MRTLDSREGNLDQRTVKILHGDVAKAGSFDPEDLEYFAKVLGDLLRDASEAVNPSGDAEDVAQTKVELAVALFQCAAPGERDYERLKEKTLAAWRAERERSERSPN